MSVQEADTHIARLEHEENIPLCHAIVGRIPATELDEDTRQVYDEFMRWSQDRTRRFRNEQVADRYRERENRVANALLRMHEHGLIPEQTLLLYGISGELPERRVYLQMSDEEKQLLWRERMVNRYGVNWRRRFTYLPEFLREKEFIHDWKKEGF